VNSALAVTAEALVATDAAAGDRGAASEAGGAGGRPGGPRPPPVTSAAAGRPARGAAAPSLTGSAADVWNPASPGTGQTGSTFVHAPDSAERDTASRTSCTCRASAKDGVGSAPMAIDSIRSRTSWVNVCS
jgi:hypothetical protein